MEFTSCLKKLTSLGGIVLDVPSLEYLAKNCTELRLITDFRLPDDWKEFYEKNNAKVKAVLKKFKYLSLNLAPQSYNQY